MSPSRSIGQGSGISSIQKVSQPIEQGIDLPPQQDGELLYNLAEDNVELYNHAEVSPLQDFGVKNTRFRGNDVSSIDWYYNNYNKEYSGNLGDMPIGGNMPEMEAIFSSSPSIMMPAFNPAFFVFILSCFVRFIL